MGRGGLFLGGVGRGGLFLGGIGRGGLPLGVPASGLAPLRLPLPAACGSTCVASVSHRRHPPLLLRLPSVPPGAADDAGVRSESLACHVHRRERRHPRGVDDVRLVLDAGSLGREVRGAPLHPPPEPCVHVEGEVGRHDLGRVRQVGVEDRGHRGLVANAFASFVEAGGEGRPALDPFAERRQGDRLVQHEIGLGVVLLDQPPPHRVEGVDDAQGRPGVGQLADHRAERPPRGVPRLRRVDQADARDVARPHQALERFRVRGICACGRVQLGELGAEGGGLRQRRRRRAPVQLHDARQPALVRPGQQDEQLGRRREAPRALSVLVELAGEPQDVGIDAGVQAVLDRRDHQAIQEVGRHGPDVPGVLRNVRQRQQQPLADDDDAILHQAATDALLQVAREHVSTLETPGRPDRPSHPLADRRSRHLRVLLTQSCEHGTF